MPCDTNNDPSDSYYTAGSTFSSEKTLVNKWLLNQTKHTSKFLYGEDVFETTNEEETTDDDYDDYDDEGDEAAVAEG